MRIVGPGLALACSALLACSETEPSSPIVSEHETLVPLAARQGPIDTSRLIRRFRERGGGPVFIRLTAEPRHAELASFERLGLRAPDGLPRVVHFDSLKIRTVWGVVTAEQVKRLAELPYVELIESSEDVDSIMIADDRRKGANAFASPSDIRWNVTRVRAPEIWSAFGATGWRQTGPGTYQAAGVWLLDNGLDYRMHQYLSSPWEWYTAPTNRGDYVNEAIPVHLGTHGTAVGGIVAAESNDVWVAGVAPRASLSIVKVLPFSGTDLQWGRVVAALNLAYTYGPSVINMSFANCGELPPATVKSALQQLAARVPGDAGYPGVGVSLVAAAGNGTAQGCATNTVGYPAKYPEVIAVSAVTSKNAFPSGYSQGPEVELAAPGYGLITLRPSGGTDSSKNGTSYAAPHVAGLIAAIRAQNNTWSAATVRAKLQQYAKKVAGQALPRDNRFGYGIVDPYEVLSHP